MKKLSSIIAMGAMMGALGDMAMSGVKTTGSAPYRKSKLTPKQAKARKKAKAARKEKRKNRRK